MKSFAFRHPGTMMSPEMTRTLKEDIAKDPVRKQAFESLKKDTPSTYQPLAIAEVNIGYGGVGKGHKECTTDGEMAYKAALLYWATHDQSYANLAINILTAWATKNKVFTGDNAPLEAAWSICSMARAAELLRDQPLWKTIKPHFLTWIDHVVKASLWNKDVWKWNIKGNWHFSILCARMQLAILRDDTEEFMTTIKLYQENLPRAICIGHPCHTSETKRDCTHAQFLLGGLLQLPEMAYHQGFDIFDQRLHSIMEYHARVMMKEVPDGITKEEIKTPYGYWNEPVWEIGLAHFQGRKNIPMPKTEQNLQKFRPERVTFHWGAATLTHYKRTSPKQ